MLSPQDARVYHMDPGFKALVRELPDMDFLLSAEDSPRVYMPPPGAADIRDVGAELRVFDMGPETSLMARCGNATGVRAAQSLHSMFLGYEQPFRVEQLVPVLSPSRVEGCHLDIVLPTWTARPSHLEATPQRGSGVPQPVPHYAEWGNKLDEVRALRAAAAVFTIAHQEQPLHEQVSLNITVFWEGSCDFGALPD